MRKKEPKQPKFILDGVDLYIHVDDLLRGMKDVENERSLPEVIQALEMWKATKRGPSRK